MLHVSRKTALGNSEKQLSFQKFAFSNKVTIAKISLEIHTSELNNRPQWLIPKRRQLTNSNFLNVVNPTMIHWMFILFAMPIAHLMFRLIFFGRLSDSDSAGSFNPSTCITSLEWLKCC